MSEQKIMFLPYKEDYDLGTIFPFRRLAELFYAHFATHLGKYIVLFS